MLKLADPDLDVNPVARLDAAFQVLRGRVLKATGDAKEEGTVDAIELESVVAGGVAALGRAAMADLLASLVPDADDLDVDGVRYRRLNQETTGRYGTLFGRVEVDRPLYRQVDGRNGPTVDVIAARFGLMDGFTPACAFAISHAVQAMPAREAQQVFSGLGLLPYSRSTFQRVPDRVGRRWDAVAPEVLAELGVDSEVLAQAVAVVAEVDRVSTPMAEPRKPTEKDLERGVKRPLDVALRMSFCGCLALLDDGGRVLDTLRFAHVPEGGRGDLEDAMKQSLDAVLACKPSLKVATVADGAEEMQAMLREITSNQEVACRLVDVWHLLGYVRKAGAALGESVSALIDGLFERAHGIDDMEAWANQRLRELGAEAPEALVDAQRYLDNREHLVDYHRARQLGVPIGSGHVEATCKTVVSVRFKRAGARWGPEGAQHLLALRALATSGDRWQPALAAMAEREAHDVRWAA